ncbi:MAG: hypothetical protein HFJ36_04590 [Clostridia bacterium]|nr:hypothetical protein [Clostridia bacterium]
MKNLKNKMKDNKAITLTALVVTIVILIILAGITINSILGDEGILKKAQQATQNYSNAQAEEEDKIAKYANEIDNYINGSSNETTIDKQELKMIISELLSNKTSELDYDNLVYLTEDLTEINKTYTFEKNGQLIFQMGVNAGGYYYSTIKHNDMEINWIRFHNATSGGQQHTEHAIVNAGDTITVTHISKIQPLSKNIIFIPFK